MNRHRVLGLLLASIVVLACSGTVQAQVTQEPGAIWETATVAGYAERAPGRLVSEGVGRAITNAPDPLFRYEITEPDPRAPYAELLSQVLADLFTQFNTFISALAALIVARAGGTPSLFG